MYATETQDSEATLEQQLAQDTAGELRDRLLDELFLAASDIEEALANGSEIADAPILRELLEATRIAQTTVAEVWRSFHG
jgi:hypothetical protein